ncbi:dentin sialophosphoprotein-like [Ptychodera flava]|uniref:dentin sialophosphoprotein-like n=1 Tax=Ptychodera flava TaxID=63121 RepID=UPI003969ED31
MKKQGVVMSQRSAVTEVTVIDSQFDNFRDYIDIIQVYHCRICGYHSPLRHAIASHMSEVHFPKTCYLCQLCQFVYEDKAQLRHHITTTHAAECSDEAMRFEATINPPSIMLPPGFVPNGIPYSQLRHYGNAAPSMVMATNDNNLNGREGSALQCDGLQVHNFSSGDVNCAARVSENHTHLPAPCHPEEGYMQQVVNKSVEQNISVSVKKELFQTRGKKTEDGRQDHHTSSYESQIDNTSEKDVTKNQPSVENPESDHPSSSNTDQFDNKIREDNQAHEKDNLATSNTEQEKREKRRGKTKSRTKPSLSAVLTNLAAQHVQSEIDTNSNSRKRESVEQESTSSEGDSDNTGKKDDSDGNVNKSNGGYSPAEKSHGNHSISGHFITYKKAQSSGLPPKKIKLEVIENLGLSQDQKSAEPRYDGPYNADGSFDYYSLTGWKAYQCDLCNKGKRGRRVSFKTAQELAEHGYFVHGKPMPLPVPPDSSVQMGMIGDTTAPVRSDARVPFNIYPTPMPWPPQPALHVTEGSQGRGSLRSVPVLDLSVPPSLSSTEGGSDVNGDDHSMSNDQNHTAQVNDDDDDSQSDDSRSTVAASDSMRFIPYHTTNSDNKNGQGEFITSDPQEPADSIYIGHKVRKTFSSRLAALQRGEISRKKDPKFDESIIKNSYNADGSFDYFSLTGWKAYKCELCKKRRFKTATELAEHKQAMHPGMEMTDNNPESTMDEQPSPVDVEKLPTSENEGAG